MIILNPGYSATVTLASLESLAVVPRGSVVVEAVSGLGLTAGVIATTSTARTFGPYSAGVIRLTASGGDCSYGVTAAPSYDPANSSIVLAQSGVAASITGTLTETTLATITIPGGSMGANGAVRIDVSASWTVNTNLKTFNVKLGGVSIAAFARSGAAESGCRSQIIVRNRGSQSSQILSLPASTATIFGVFSGTYPATLGRDTSVDQALTITGTLANTADTITLEAYTVELLRSPAT